MFDSELIKPNKQTNKQKLLRLFFNLFIFSIINNCTN